MSKKIHLLVLVVWSILSFQAKVLYAQPAWLDNNFSSDGKVLTQFGVNFEGASAVTIQTDGKIVVAGAINNSTANLILDFAVARYLSNGTLDNTFSTDGKLTLDLGSDNDEAFAVAVQSDGKILVAGVFDNGTDNDFALVRFTADGTLDNTFNSTGIVKTSLSGTGDEAHAVLVQTNGKIVVAGTSGGDFGVARYNSDGTLDVTFNGQGWIRTDFGAGDNGMGAILQPDGKILVGGEAFIGGSKRFAVARYNTDGTLDNSFSGNGKADTYIGIKNSGATSIALQANGKIVLAGYAEISTTKDFAVACFKPDGALDSTFGSNPGRINYGNTTYDQEAYGVEVQSDGKIVVSGYSANFTGYGFYLVRFLTNGNVDNTYGIGGTVSTGIAGVDDEGRGMTIQSDNKVVVVGYGDDGNDNYAWALARFNVVATSDIKKTSVGNTSVKIYPNPGNGIYNIAMANYDNAVVEVYNTMGALIYKANASETNTIDISNYSNGLYIVKVFDDNNVIALQKIVKQ